MELRKRSFRIMHRQMNILAEVKSQWAVISYDTPFMPTCTKSFTLTLEANKEYGCSRLPIIWGWLENKFRRTIESSTNP
jgi:hypothetical protein